ncbi:MAG: urate hydroxylase PuuD [Pseudomonadales bacterium]
MIDAAVLDWLNLLLRFAHVVTAIAWIGASFYFIWLDLSLQTPSAEKLERGLGGELWAIHGGGIYEVGKYTLAPPAMPGTLHWFKWEAYSTWLTGTALMITYYYFRADTQLHNAQGWLASPAAAVAASIGILLAGLACYELLVRAVRPFREGALALQMAVLLVLLTAVSWLSFQLFAPRAAILHVGAMLATIMAANVFLGIVPSQKALVGAIERGDAPDAALAVDAKRRSTHNNYLTLPVLFCMLSNHSPFVFSHPHAWLLVAAIAATAMAARHFFNAKHTGKLQPAWLVGAFVAFVLIAIVAGKTAYTVAAVEGTVTSAQVQPIVSAHCSVCHSEMPTQPGFVAPPGGYLFRTPADIDAQAALVATSLASGYMPLGNLTGMTDAERSLLASWALRSEQ